MDGAARGWQRFQPSPATPPGDGLDLALGARVTVGRMDERMSGGAFAARGSGRAGLGPGERNLRSGGIIARATGNPPHQRPAPTPPVARGGRLQLPTPAGAHACCSWPPSSTGPAGSAEPGILGSPVVDAAAIATLRADLHELAADCHELAAAIHELRAEEHAQNLLQSSGDPTHHQLQADLRRAAAGAERASALKERARRNSAVRLSEYRGHP